MFSIKLRYINDQIILSFCFVGQDYKIKKKKLLYFYNNLLFI